MTAIGRGRTPLVIVAATLAVMLAACMPVTGAREKPYQAGNQPSYPRTGAALPAGHTTWSNESLADLFVRLTHDLEWGQRRPNLVRFEEPVRVGVFGSGARRYSGFLDRFLSQLRAQTGIPISRAPSPQNLMIRFIPGAEFRAKLPQHFCVVAPGRLSWAEFQRDPVRHGTRSFERARRVEAMTVYIPDTLEPYLVRLCLIEEIAQALGPANDLFGAGMSIFNDDNVHIWPTALDYLMLRVLYQPEMQTGLSRAETRRRARQILARLNPQGRNAPVLPALRQTEMADWGEAVQSRATSATGYQRERRKAVALAERRAPGSAYHCHSLIALARHQRRTPDLAIGTLAKAAQVCDRAHGSADLRLAFIRLERARALFKTGRASAALGLTDGLETILAEHGQDERLVALYDLKAASLRAIQQGAKSFEARRRAAEWGAYALGRDHADVRRFLTQ